MGWLKVGTLVGCAQGGTLVGHGPRPVVAVPLEGPKGTPKVPGSVAAGPMLAGLQASAGLRCSG